MAEKISLTEEIQEYINKSYEFSRDGESGMSSDVWTEEVKAFLDPQTLKSLYFTEDWVFIIIDLLASKISSQPLKIYNSSPNEDGTTAWKPNDAHPLNKIILNPNENEDYHNFMYHLCTELFLSGNAICWYQRLLGTITIIPTEHVQLDFNNAGKIQNYIVQVDSDKTLTIPVKEIFHIKRPNPNSALWGMSPFTPGRKSVLFNRYTTDYLNSFYLKQATPGMALEMDKSVNEAQAIRQLRTFELAYTGRRNQRRTLLLPKGMKATPLTHSLADQRIVDLVRMNRETIINIFKIPPHELGLQASGSLGSEEYKTALKNFWEATLIPAMRMISGMMTKFFAKQLGDQSKFDFDLSSVSALADDFLTRAEVGAKMLAAGLSVNEVRERVWKAKPIESPEASIPYVLRDQQQPMQQFSLSAQPEQIEQKQLIEKESITRFIDTKIPDWKDTISKQMTDITEGDNGQAFNAFVMEILTSMSEEAVKVTQNELVEKAAQEPNRKELRKRLNEAFDKFEGEWVNEYMRRLKSSVDIGYDQQLNFVFNEQDRKEIEALKTRGDKQRRATLEARGLSSFAQVSTTHTETIMREITKGVEEGETVQQVAKRIRDTFANPEKWLARSKTIARTEMLTAVSLGQNAALKNAKKVLPNLKKAWITANDERVRDTHFMAQEDGAIGVDDSFSNGLEYPREPGAPAEEAINCRCTLIIIPEGEKLNG
jgi:HK97 family phage portal protein